MFDEVSCIFARLICQVIPHAPVQFISNPQLTQFRIEYIRSLQAYRATAEVLEAIGEIAAAVEYCENALQKNPEIGVKRRLTALRPRLI